jgi:hypothetical protein
VKWIPYRASDEYFSTNILESLNKQTKDRTYTLNSSSTMFLHASHITILSMKRQETGRKTCRGEHVARWQPMDRGMSIRSSSSKNRSPNSTTKVRKLRVLARFRRRSSHSARSISMAIPGRKAVGRESKRWLGIRTGLVEIS